MEAVVLSVYRVIKFPHQGKVVTIDQLSFFHKESTQAEPDIPIIDNSTKELSNVGVDLYPTLMGTFNIPPTKSLYDFLCQERIIRCTNSIQNILLIRSMEFTQSR